MLDKGKVLESSLPQYNDVDTVFTPSGVLEPITDVAAVAHSMAQGGFSINIDTDEACKKVTKKQMKKTSNQIMESRRGFIVRSVVKNFP